MTQDKNRCIALCTCKIHDESIGKMVNDICHEAAEIGYYVTVFNSFYDFYNEDKINISSQSVFSLMDYNSFSGIIILGETFHEKDEIIINEIAQKGLMTGIPVVSVDKLINGICSVVFDYSTSFEKIVRHIIEYHRCKRVDFLGGIKNNHFSDERLNVYKNVLAENNIPVEDFRIGYGDFWEMPAAEAVRDFLSAESEPPEAIICANDTMAITACRILEEHGYSVPKDVIVTGFDGIEQEKYHSPRLTTAYRNIGRAARSAVELIDKYSENKREFVPEKVVIPYDVTFSQSCGCKPIEYKNVNNVIMDLYSKLNQYNELAICLNDMNNELTACSSLQELFPKIEKYIGFLYSDVIYMNLRKGFLFNNASDGFDKPIEPGEKMVHVISYVATRPHMEMKEYIFGEKTPYESSPVSKDHTFLIVPLNYQEKIYGYMSIRYYAGALQYENLYKFSMHFNHSLDTVKNKELLLAANDMLESTNHKLESAYAHDSMTGLLNRRGFYREIIEKTEEFIDGYLFVVSVDLDGLKCINDNFGHQEGDFAIKQIAKAIVKCSGPNGICARFGGDEFMSLIFSDRKDDPFFKDFEAQMLEEIDNINKKFNRDYRIDASLGTEVTAINEELDLDSVMRAADEKMYKNKSSRCSKVRSTKRD